MTDKKVEPKAIEAAPPVEAAKVSVVQIGGEIVKQAVRVAQFRGRPMVMQRIPYPHWTPLHKDMFEKIAYPLLGGVSRSRIGDIFSYVTNTADDLTVNEDLILFGLEQEHEDYVHERGSTMVWDMERLAFVDTRYGDAAVWRSPYGAVPPAPAPPAEPATTGPDYIPFILSLAGGDKELYGDIMQSLAPLVMRRKPDGVIWWVGDGANGKSTLMDAVYRIFPGQLSSITVKRLTDGRDTPSLNGTLANVVKESSEGRIEDTEIYKAVGTHENFRVHKFHSQDDIEIRGNMHHIFSGNAVPTFNDKGYSARRRTFIIPFGQTFESDPTFEEATFNPEMFGRLIAEMCRYAKIIEHQGYRYKWSASTLSAKADYDTDANNAEEYAKYLVSDGIVGFDSFAPVKIDYENWCADNGYVPLGITNLRRAMGTLGFIRMTQRGTDGTMMKLYRLPALGANELQALGMGRPGLYSTPGFKPAPIEEPMVMPSFHEPTESERDEPELTPEPPKKTILKGRW